MNSRLENKGGEQAYRVAYLIAGFMRGNLTIDEHNELDEWVASSDENMQLFERLTDEANLNELEQLLSHSEEQRRLDQLKSSMEFSTARSHSAIWWVSGIAACLVVFVCWYFFIANKPAEENTGSITTPVQDIAPGTSQATLTLGSGEVVQLGIAGRQKEISEAGVRIVEQGNGIVYQDTSATLPAVNHLLSVPVRGCYQITLSDGTRVWLNAGSSLRFPSRFEKERTVSLEGEAYFEVNRNPAKPFRVISSGAEVEVLGTRFNVKNYKDDNQAVITLLEGRVEAVENNTSHPLAHGEELRIDGRSVNKISQADTLAAIGWKNGYFEFHDTPIPEIMKQIERWYGVKVVFQENNEHELTASIERSKTLISTLRALQLTNRVHFKVDADTITVLK